MSNPIQEFLDNPEITLEEAKRAQLVRVTKITKIRQHAGAIAMKMARKNKDPMYLKYMKFRKKALMYKEKVMKKYSKRALAQARSAR